MSHNCEFVVHNHPPLILEPEGFCTDMKCEPCDKPAVAKWKGLWYCEMHNPSEPVHVKEAFWIDCGFDEADFG